MFDILILRVSAFSRFMADWNDKLPENAPGRFYVDRQCIDCDVCRDTSPRNFARNDENGYSYICKQPETPEELALCEEAFMACPVEAIGEDVAEKFFRDRNSYPPVLCIE